MIISSRVSLSALMVVVGMLLLADGTNAQAAAGGLIGGLPFILLLIICILVVPCVVPFWLWYRLLVKDELLSGDRRCMTLGMNILYWIIFFLTAGIGNLVFYFFAASEIDRRIIQSGAGNQVPVQAQPVFAQNTNKLVHG